MDIWDGLGSLFGWHIGTGNEDDTEIQDGSDAGPVTGVSISMSASQHPGQVTKFYGESVTLTANVVPSNAANKAVRWTDANAFGASDNPPSLSSATGNPVVVTASSSGRAQRKITVTTMDGNKQASIILIVCRDIPDNPQMQVKSGGADFYKGPHTSNYGSALSTISAGTLVYISAQYNDNWVYLKNPSTEKWGYVQVNRLENVAAADTTPDIRWPSVGHYINAASDLQGAWGWRINPSSGGLKIHKGVDIRNDPNPCDGTAVYAIASGYVRRHEEGIADKTGRGYYIIIEHDIPGKGKYCSSYCHLQSSGRAVDGSYVSAGDVIGKVGSTGGSTGPHLHFEFWRGTQGKRSDAYINPTNLYAHRDSRTASDNPEPLFKKTGSIYAYNSNFDWTYSDTLPKRYSHSTSYQN